MAVSPERPGARLTGRGRSFIIHDKNGQKLAHVYFEYEPGQ
jgi:hypothetical protein